MDIVLAQCLLCQTRVQGHDIALAKVYEISKSAHKTDWQCITHGKVYIGGGRVCFAGYCVCCSERGTLARRISRSLY